MRHTRLSQAESSTFCHQGAPHLARFNCAHTIAQAHVVGVFVSWRRMGRYNNRPVAEAVVQVNGAFRNFGQAQGQCLITLYAFMSGYYVIRASLPGDIIQAYELRYICFNLLEPEPGFSTEFRNGWAALRCYNLTARISKRWDRDSAVVKQVQVEFDKERAESIQEAGKRGELW